MEFPRRFPALFQRSRPLLFLPLFGLLLLTSQTRADRMEHRGIHFWVRVYDPSTERLELHLPDEAGTPNTFPKVAEIVEKEGRELLFATNSGIFEGNFRPTGLHISEGETVVGLNLKSFRKEREAQLTPNFYLKPNGVFALLEGGRGLIAESRQFRKLGVDPVLATQSGPLLVSEGTIHPILTESSTSTRYRNGVGVREDGAVVFACSVLDPEVGFSNLYHFAEFFRDKLDCPDALYLDGDISYIYLKGETPPIHKTNWFAGIFTITKTEASAARE